MNPRYTFGGDEHLFVEMDEAMSLEAFFKAFSLCTAIRESRITGVTEICPANASLQVRFDPDVIKPNDILAEVKRLEQQSSGGSETLKTRILELPVLFNDPWTHETLMRFRERHQDPKATDLEYAARINGYPDIEAFIEAYAAAPWFVSMVGFVAGCPFMFQMVERAKQIEVPKYLRPRTDTPKQTVGHGGCFTAIYPVRGAGGYQMFGITPLPIYDPHQHTSYLREFMVLFRPGDIVKFKPVTREAYDDLVRDVAREDFALKSRDVTFALTDFQRSPAACSTSLLETLYAD